MPSAICRCGSLRSTSNRRASDAQQVGVVALDGRALVRTERQDALAFEFLEFARERVDLVGAPLRLAL